MRRTLSHPAVQLVLAAALATSPLFADRYPLHLATLIAAFWVLIAGLNLVVGFTGQLSIGHVGLLAAGAYIYGYLTLHDVTGPYVALAAAGAAGGALGFLLGLPSLRLPGFYFAMVTLAFTLIVTELAVALTDVTGGGTGMPIAGFPEPFDTPDGQYVLTACIAAIVTAATVLATRSTWGRAMASVRDSTVMAASVGIAPYRIKLAVFTFSGVTAGLAGALFGSLQSYVTPDTFAFDLGLFFFICIIIGGRGSILGPFIGTAVLSLLPELVAPLAKFSHLFYGVLLLGVILLVPGGLGQFFVSLRRSPVLTETGAGTGARTLPMVAPAPGRLEVNGLSRAFGAVKALDDVGLALARGTVHGLIGPNGSGKTTLLNMMTGFYAPDAGHILLDGADITRLPVSQRPALGIGRTFQTPRVVQDLSVLENVMAGGWTAARASFVEALAGAPRSRSDERRLRERAVELLAPLGLLPMAGRAANALTHAELRFLEIARALMPNPAFLLLDEPASGLTAREIERLAATVDRLRREGTGVLLVEHHTDLVFGLSDTVTTLHLGRVICAGTPAAVRTDPQVRRVYLGGQA